MRPDPAHAGAIAAHSGRDLSWLRFDERVLEVAEATDRPVLDRARFLSISASNLDEFFMKRVALLRRRLQAGLERSTHDGLTVRQQLEAVRERVESLQARQHQCWQDNIEPELHAQAIRPVGYDSLPDRVRRRVDRWFKTQVFPLLTPLAVDPGHPFPFISNLSLNFGILLSSPGDGRPRFARLKIPDLIPVWIRVPTSGPITSIEGAATPVRVLRSADVIRENLPAVFPGMCIEEVFEFRVTRSVGLEEEDDDIDDLFEAVEAALRHRRFAEAVRLETHPDVPGHLVSMLLEELELDASCHYSRPGLLDWSQVADLARIDRPDLRSPRWKPVTPPRLHDDRESMFDVIGKGDLLVHHPYESFRASVERFISEAADDPDVVAIKQCLYRTDPDSPFIHSLLRAAESGKQVACLVELRARFDEDRNLQLTRVLEKHGVHVTWGVVGLKTHAKCSLVIRREGEGYRAYGHVGSGNYHPVTANHYTDMGLLTCDPKVTGDLVELFNFLTGRSRHDTFQRLLVGPLTLRRRLEELINTEIENAQAGKPSGIRAKMNQLEDRRMIELIKRASAAGVPVDLQVRGFCCLHPGVPGVTEKVCVRSIIGDFLEHARIYHFRNGQPDPLDGHWMIGSADWMERNLSHRVEVVVPVAGRENVMRLKRAMDVAYLDAKNAWIMQPDGSYQRAQPDLSDEPDSVARLGSFDALCRDALAMEVDAISHGAPTIEAEPAAIRAPAPDLPAVDRMIGLVLLDEPWRTRGEIARRAGVSSRIAAAAGSRLEAAGMLHGRSLGRTTLWEPTPLLADAVGGPMVPIDAGVPWVRQWLMRRVSAHIRRTGGDARSLTEADLVTQETGGPRVAWAFFESLQGIRERVNRCLAFDADQIELIGLDRAACQTLRRRVERKAAGRDVRIRPVTSLVRATQPDLEGS
ncbi:MAG: polyphosphate kinase 1 [Phycisphaerales bacterium]|nr:polyphosphate kinase 1 [Phycisphaerales bacterium]